MGGLGRVRAVDEVDKLMPRVEARDSKGSVPEMSFKSAIPVADGVEMLCLRSPRFSTGGVTGRACFCFCEYFCFAGDRLPGRGGGGGTAFGTADDRFVNDETGTELNLISAPSCQSRLEGGT